MAKMTSALRTCGLIFICVSTVFSVENTESEPWIVSYNVDAKSCFKNSCKYIVNLGGGEYLGHFSIRLTPEKRERGATCDIIYPSYELREVATTKWLSTVNITIPKVEGKFYFCLLQNEIPNMSFGGKWVHQGEEFYLDPLHDHIQMNSKATERTNSSTQNEYNTQAADLLEREGEWTDLTHDTDVNYLPGVHRPTREEASEIEVLLGDSYVPLVDVLDNNRSELELVEIGEENGGLETIKRESIEVSEEEKGNVKVNEDREVIERVAEVKSELNETQSKIINGEGKELEERIVIGDLKDDKEANLKLSEANMSLKGKLDRSKRNILDGPKTNETIKVISVLQIEGLRVEFADKMHIVDGVPSVLAHSEVSLRLFGHGLCNRTVIAFTYEELTFGEPCKFLVKGEYMVVQETITDYSALFDITAPVAQETHSRLYICAKQLEGSLDPTLDRSKFFHQGSETYKAFVTHTPLFPLWFSLTLIVVCLCFSALFSGLNLGLMSLDRTELKIIANTGTEEEKSYARAIMPVRDHGNYLLCSILLGNVAVNSTFTILLDELTSGLFAIILSTISIVLLGEITPQAICSRHGLKIGAKSIMITKAVMGITAPLAYPVSKLLDYFLGEEIGNVYNRERLKELVKVTTGVNDLDKDEVNIISGALELRKKTVSDVMTKLEDIFMLPINSVLDFETMSEIIRSGYSRIPVYEANRNIIITVLFIKDLAFVDPDDNTPLRTLCQYYQNPCNFVFEDVTLDVMFKQFKEGHKGHMAFVHRINNEGEGDPFYETIGLVTLEDVIEELIQAEIVDETDVFMDNRSKRRRNKPQNKLQDFLAFAERHENQRIHISPQLTLAAFQFLSTSVEAFRPDLVSENVLRRLLKQDVIQHIKVKAKDKKDPSTYVFQQGKAVDYFVLVLEGRVEVTVGRENLVFESGPFTYFGIQALMQNVGVAESPSPSAMGSLQNINMDSILRHSFVPDYSVRAISEVFYLTVKRSLYLAAKRATLMEKGVLSKEQSTNDQFDTEVDKLFQSVEEELSMGDQKTPSRQISPNPMPASCSAITKAVFTSPRSPEPRNGSVQRDGTEEQEKLIPPIT